MQAIEFQTTLQNGTIEIPEELREKISGQVRVIVLAEEETEDEQNYLDYLIENPIDIPGFKPMKRDEIYSGKRFGD